MSISSATNQTFIAFRALGSTETSVHVSFLQSDCETSNDFTTSNGWTSRIDTNIKTNYQPAAAVWNGKYVIASVRRWMSSGGLFNPLLACQIQIAVSSDGVTWTQPVRLNKFTSMEADGQGPALAVFRDQLYLAYLGPTGFNAANVLVCSSADGVSFSASSASVPSASTMKTPALAVFGDALWTAWQGTDGKIYFSSSSDGVTWTAAACPAGLNGATVWSTAPSLAVYNGRLHVAIVDKNNNVCVTSSADGVSWPAPPVAIGQQSQNGVQATISAADGMLIVSSKVSASSAALDYSTSVDGTHWVRRGQFGQASASAPAIASGPAETLPLQFRAPTENRLFLAFQANDGNKSLRACFYDSGSAPLTSNGWTSYTSTGSQNKGQPTAVVWRSQYFIGYVVSDAANSNAIQIVSSADGVSWSPPVRTNQTSGHGPALAVFQNQLYLAFCTNDSTDRVVITSSPDGVAWPTSYTQIGSAVSSQPPALVVCQNLLWAAWANSAGTIFLSSTPDGLNWSTPQSFTISGGGNCPSLAVLNNNIYVTFLCKTNQVVYVTKVSVTNGEISASSVSVGRTALSNQQPAIGSSGDTLYITYPISGKNLEYCTSTDGVTWVVRGQFGKQSGTTPALASGAVGALPMSLLGSNQMFAAYKGIDENRTLFACFYDSKNAPYTTNGFTGCVDTNNRTRNQPSAVLFKSRYFIGFVDNDGTSAIKVTACADGVSWPPGTSTNQTSTRGPALAVFQNRLYLAFSTTDGTNRVMLTSSDDGATWPTSAAAIASAVSTQPPALAVYQNRLWVSWADSAGAIFWSSSSDGATWSTPTSFTIAGGCNCPSLAVLGGSLYVTFLSKSNWGVYVASTSSTSGQLASAPVSIGRTALANQQPGIGAFGDTLFLVYPVSGQNLEYCSSTDGVNWVVRGQFGQQSGTTPCLASGSMPQVPRLLLAPPSQAMRITTRQPVSAISNFDSTSVTMEAWICPSSLDSKQVVLRLSNPEYRQLLLTVGGTKGALSCMIYSQGMIGIDPGVLCASPVTTPGIAAELWAHIAVTLSVDRSANPYATNIALYVNGQQVASQSAGSLIAGPVLAEILDAPIIPNVEIGGDFTKSGSTIAMYQGRIAEARIWNIALGAAEISARYLSRVRGDEPGLMACYRLEEAPQNYIHDSTAQHGFAKVASGNSIYTARQLPLVPTQSATSINVSTMTKLVNESIIERGSYDYATYSQQSPGSYACAEPGLVSNCYTVFDSTLKAKAADGTPLPNSSFYIRPDGDLRVFLDQGDFAGLCRWNGGRTYSIAVPASGKLRLRFLAISSEASLSLPGLRVRVDGMPADAWIVVRPDEGAQSSMCNLDANDLLSPKDKRSSPLPAGMSADDANALVSTMLNVNRCVPPPSRSDSVPAHTTYKLAPSELDSRLAAYADDIMTASFTSTVSNLWNGATSTVDGLVDTLETAPGHLLQLAGDACGTLKDAFIDDGTANLGSLTGALKSAANLVPSGDALTDLINAAKKARPRLGSKAISECIKAADTLAFGSDPWLTNGLAIIGTAIIDGKKVAWRAVCSCAKEGLAAAKEFCNRVSVEWQKMVDYLAYLFNFGDFLAASDQAYALIKDTVFPEINTLIDGAAKYKSMLSQYLTIPIPSDVGEKSLLQLMGLNLDPDNPTLKELEYIVEIAEKVVNVQNLAVSEAEKALTDLVSSLSGIDLSMVSGNTGSFLTSSPSAALKNPIALLSTPVQSLINTALTGSSSTSVVDFLFDKLLGGTKSLLAVAQTMIEAHIDVPYVTSWVEQTFLGGRKLSILRLISLIAAIPKVLADKLIASFSGSPAVSFAEPSAVAPWVGWVKLAFQTISAILITGTAVYRYGIAKKLQSGTEYEKYTIHLSMACFDIPISLMEVALCIVDSYDSYVPANAPTIEGAPMGDMYTAMHAITAIGPAMTGVFSLVFRGLGSDSNSWMFTEMVQFLFNAFALFNAGFVTVKIAIKPGIFTSDNAKVLFALKSGAHLLHFTALLMKSTLLLYGPNKVQIALTTGLAVAAVGSELGAAIVQAKT